MADVVVYHICCVVVGPLRSSYLIRSSWSVTVFCFNDDYLLHTVCKLKCITSHHTE